jgi:hypothetical protein
MRLKPAMGGDAKGRKFTADSDSDIYDRWAQALSSAYDLFREAIRGVGGRGDRNEMTLVIPIVVVPNGTLWAICYDENGEIKGKPTETDECQVYVGHCYVWLNKAGDVRRYTVSHFHLNTLSGLESLLTRIACNGATGWSEWFMQGSAES